jgi:cell division septation protein DedD
MVFTGCKSKESAYKQAYEKAKAAETAQEQAAADVQTTEVPVVTPLETKPVTETKVVDNVDSAPVREEKVSVVNGTGLSKFSVVVGSFSVIANAEGLQQRLKNAGYAAQVVKREDNGMYRVVASTFEDKAAAVQSRNALRGTQFNPNSDAWLLVNAK